MNKKVIAAVGGLGGAIALIVGAQVYASYQATKEVDKAISSVSEFVNIDYKKVNSSLLGGGTKVKDITISPVETGETFRVDEVVVYDYDVTDDIPTRINMAVNGMAVNVADLGQNAAPLKEFGYGESLSVNFATEYEYEETTQEIRLKKFEVGADEVGDLDMNVYVSNVSLDPAAIASMPFSLFSMVFHEAEITYKDDSLVTRVFDTAAAANGVSVDEFKEEAIASLKADLASGEEGLTEDIVEEMTDFINDPEGFSISINPSEPVPLSTIMTASSTEDMIKLLNVQFKS